MVLLSAHFFLVVGVILPFFFVLQGFSNHIKTTAAILFQDCVDSFSTVLLTLSFIVKKLPEKAVASGTK
jgi:hypothetical protein